MIQDIYPHKLHNEYDPAKKPSPESFVMAFRGNEVLLNETDGKISFPKAKEFPAWSAEPDGRAGAGKEAGADTAADRLEMGDALQFLFTVDEDDYFLLKDLTHGFVPSVDGSYNMDPDEDPAGAADEANLKLPEGCAFRASSSLRTMSLRPRHLIFAEYTGHQLARWYNDNRFCGTCGSLTVHSEKERAMVCTKCHRTIYPRILPAVIVALKSADGERLLLTKYANRPFTNYALIAGFTEIGETLEETVAREVMEEVGLKVKNIRYYKSQPWAVADDILMGFYCDVDGDETIDLDHNELKLGAWFTRDEVVLQDTDFSLTNEMMTEFKEGRQ